MVTFEDKIKNLTEEEITDIKKVCKDYCGECPTHAGTGEKELAFCINGKSKIIKEENGCLCSACPINERLLLRWQYYCMKGSGKEQSLK